MKTDTTLSWAALEALCEESQRGDPLSSGVGEALSEEIVRCEVLQNGAIYRQLVCLRLFERSGGWEGWGSLEAWMSVKLGLSYKTANERLRVARKLAHLPKIDAAFRAGEISYTKVRAIHDVATPENEGVLLEQARWASGEQLRRLTAPLRAAAKRAQSSQAAREAELKACFVEHAHEDLVELRATLLPEDAALVRKALEVALELLIKKGPANRGALDPARVDSGSGASAADSAAADLASGASAAAEADSGSAAADSLSAGTSAALAGSAAVDASGADTAPRARADSAAAESLGSGASRTESAAGSAAAEPVSERLSFVEALVFVAEGFLAQPPEQGVPAGRRELIVHTYPDSGGGAPLGSGLLETGAGISAETVERLACDGASVRVQRGAEGEVLGVGRRTRRIGRSLGRALEVRDPCCRFPGCARRAMLDAHHLVAWSEGGKTNLPNLIRLCRTHHRHVHEGGWTVQRDAEGLLEFRDPHGRPAERPGALPRVGAPEACAAAEELASGLAPEAEGLTALGGGEPVEDYSYASSVLADCCGFEVDPSQPDEPPPAIRWLRRAS